MSITDREIMSSLAMTSATRESELLRIIEDRNEQICRLRHDLDDLEKKYDELQKEMSMKGGAKDAVGNR